MKPFAYFWQLVHTGTSEQINSGICLHPDLPPNGPDDTPGFEYVSVPLYKHEGNPATITIQQWRDEAEKVPALIGEVEVWKQGHTILAKTLETVRADNKRLVTAARYLAAKVEDAALIREDPTGTQPARVMMQDLLRELGEI